MNTANKLWCRSFQTVLRLALPILPYRDPQLLDGIGAMKLGEYKENTIDAFGDAYEYLMSMYASNAGKSGGEFFTPQEVSELLTRLAVVGKTEVNKVYEIKTQNLIQSTAA